MKQKRHTEELIIYALKQAEAGVEEAMKDLRTALNAAATKFE